MPRLMAYVTKAGDGGICRFDGSSYSVILVKAQERRMHIVKGYFALANKLAAKRVTLAHTTGHALDSLPEFPKALAHVLVNQLKVEITSCGHNNSSCHTLGLHPVGLMWVPLAVQMGSITCTW